MTITGCPPDYRIGFSLPLWIIFIILAFILGILTLNQRRQAFANKKELLLGGAIFFIGQGVCHVLIQISIFNSIYFNILFAIAVLISFLSIVPLVYSWERNISKWKYIPSFIGLISGIVAIVSFIFALAINTILDTNFLQFIFMPVYFFLFGLTLQFVNNVIGTLRTKGLFFLVGNTFYFMGAFLDHVPACMLFNLSTIVSPIFFIMSFPILFWSFGGIADGLSDYYQQAHICTIHKGEIKEEQKMFICPSCNVLYCDKCYDLVVRKEGCWNCGYGFKKEEKDDQTSNKEEFDVISVNNEEINEKHKKKQIK